MSAYHENALQPGSTLAEYTIESVLGYGGFSITYLASDTSLGAQVAIKEYFPQEIAGRADETAFVIPRASKDAIRHYHWGLKNFVKEARALARFKHPNIVRVLRFLEAHGTAYTVMEYEQGQTMAQYLKDLDQKLDESNLLRIVMPILNGLNAVHEVGLLHLDIKPENIYLRQDGTPMLIDFGSARHAMTESRPTGRVTLTHGYAPVEQYPDKGKLGPWSDVYALGATMYRCISGKRPDDALERYRAVLDYKTDPMRPAIRAGHGKYRPVILECVDRAMQIYAKDRPQTAREFQDELLGRAKSARPATVMGMGSSAGSAPKPAKPRQQTKPNSASAYVFALGAVVVVGALVWVGWANISGFFHDRFDAPSAPAPARELASPATTAPTKEPEMAAKPAVSRAPAARAAIPSALRSVLSGHSDWIQAIVFAPDGKQLATAGGDRTVRLWDPESGAALTTIKQRYAVNAMDYAPDGGTLATAGTEGVVQLWDVRSRNSVKRFEAGGYPLYAVAYSPDGRRIAAAGKDRVLYLWTVADGTRRALEGHAGEINALAFKPDGKTIASASTDRSIRIWDTESGLEIASLIGNKDQVFALAFSPDGRWLASGDAGRAVRLWDMRTMALVRAFNETAQAVLSLAFARDGSWLAAGAADNSLYVYDLDGGRLAQTLSGHTDYVQALALSPDGRLLASGGRDKTIRLWQSAPN